MPEQKRVVAGYDGSAESKLAMQWAAAVAQRRGAELRVVNASGDDSSADTQSSGLADEGAQIARDHADVVVEAVVSAHGSVKALVEESATADLVVVGNRGRGRLRGVLLGSSAFSLAIHAKCPVAIVRSNLRPLPSPEFPIVVATDGSESSAAAVQEAARLASETGSTLRVVVAYETPSNAPWLVAQYPPGSEGAEDPNVWERVYETDPEGTSAEQQKNDALAVAEAAAAAATTAYPQVSTELVVEAGRPERIITDAAQDASLIVVGARGRGDFASLLLGSVSRDVIQHADCAVYIVR